MPCMKHITIRTSAQNNKTLRFAVTDIPINENEKNHLCVYEDKTAAEIEKIKSRIQKDMTNNEDDEELNPSNYFLEQFDKYLLVSEEILKTFFIYEDIENIDSAITYDIQQNEKTQKYILKVYDKNSNQTQTAEPLSKDTYQEDFFYQPSSTPTVMTPGEIKVHLKNPAPWLLTLDSSDEDDDSQDEDYVNKETPLPDNEFIAPGEDKPEKNNREKLPTVKPEFPAKRKATDTSTTHDLLERLNSKLNLLSKKTTELNRQIRKTTDSIEKEKLKTDKLKIQEKTQNYSEQARQLRKKIVAKNNSKSSTIPRPLLPTSNYQPRPLQPSLQSHPSPMAINSLIEPSDDSFKKTIARFNSFVPKTPQNPAQLFSTRPNEELTELVIGTTKKESKQQKEPVQQPTNPAWFMKKSQPPKPLTTPNQTNADTPRKGPGQT